MSNAAFRKPIVGGDDNAWATYNDAFIKSAVGEYTAYLYDDAGTLKISPGRIGINNGTDFYSCIIDTATSIDISGVTNSRWAQIEMAVSGGVPVFTATTIAAGTDASSTPTAFKNSWDTAKAGFYISATKRCIGIIWKSAAGTLFGIINAKNMTKGYSGFNYLNAGKTYTINWDRTLDVVKVSAYFPLGAWNMDATDNITITTGISPATRIKYYQCYIIDDASLFYYDIFYGGALHGAVWQSSSVTIYRAIGGVFDTTNFNDAVMNRGALYAEIEE